MFHSHDNKLKMHSNNLKLIFFFFLSNVLGFVFCFEVPRFFSIAIDRMAGFSIYAYYDDTFNSLSPDPNSLIYRHDPMSGCPAPIQNITINRLVRQIVFTNNRPAGYKSECPGNGSDVYTSIEICEIKVMGKSILK